MSTLVRMLLVSRGTCGRAVACAYHKFNLSLPESKFLNSKCECKVLFSPSSSLARYSTQADAKTSEDDTKTSTNSIDADGKELIYTGLLATNIRNVKLFSLSTSILGLAAQPIVYQQAVMAGATTKLTLPAFAVLGLFALATPPLLHMVAKRYILSVEYDHVKDKYIATTYNLFCMKKKVEFTPEDITIPTVLGMFTTCAIKGKPMFLDAKSFTDQHHYIRIMGYDKPLDLQIDDEESEKSSLKKKE